MRWFTRGAAREGFGRRCGGSRRSRRGVARRTDVLCVVSRGLLRRSPKQPVAPLPIRQRGGPPQVRRGRRSSGRRRALAERRGIVGGLAPGKLRRGPGQAGIGAQVSPENATPGAVDSIPCASPPRCSDTSPRAPEEVINPRSEEAGDMAGGVGVNFHNHDSSAIASAAHRRAPTGLIPCHDGPERVCAL